MGPEENKAIVRRMLDEGWNPANLEVFDELLSDDFVNNDPGAPHVRTRDDLKQYWTARCTAFPDHDASIINLIAEGDYVVKHWSDAGTFTGEFMGISPTGKQVSVSGLTLYRLRDGKIAELTWGYDTFGLLRQLGVIPEPEAAAASAS